jgi:GT2 family glycosyltransferase
VNLAAARFEGDWDLLCLVNPDVRLSGPILLDLREVLQETGWGIVAPLLLDPETGQPDVNARAFPAVSSVVIRTLRRLAGLAQPEEATIDPGRKVDIPVDWVSGALMVLEFPWFRTLGGFDEGFYLYGEDVDICLRSRVLGRPVGATTRVEALHGGARRSVRDLRHLRWHVCSLFRLYRKHGFSGPR